MEVVDMKARIWSARLIILRLAHFVNLCDSKDEETEQAVEEAREWLKDTPKEDV